MDDNQAAHIRQVRFQRVQGEDLDPPRVEPTVAGFYTRVGKRGVVPAATFCACCRAWG